MPILLQVLASFNLLELQEMMDSYAKFSFHQSLKIFFLLVRDPSQSSSISYCFDGYKVPTTWHP